MRAFGIGLLASTLGVAFASVASADLPFRANSTFPTDGIYLVGSNGGTADSYGEFVVILRDINNDPIGPPAVITVDFSGCTTDIRLAPQTFGGVTVSGCAVSVPVDELGVARFRIVGGAVQNGTGSGAGYECGVIKANGIFLSNVTVAAFDLSGNLDGVTSGDLATFASDFFSVPQRAVGRSDYNFDDLITGSDLSKWAQVFFASRSIQNGGVLTGCP